MIIQLRQDSNFFYEQKLSLKEYAKGANQVHGE